MAELLNFSQFHTEQYFNHEILTKPIWQTPITVYTAFMSS